jgi:hypothetical protein
LVMAIQAEPNEGQFSELIAFIRHSAELLIKAIHLILRFGVKNAALRNAMTELDSVVRSRSDELITSVLSHDYDDELERHGLSNDSPDWRFKFAGYQAAVETFEDLDVDESSPLRRVRKALNPIKTVLGWMNVALRSIASAIPGVGGAYNEIKDGVEAAIDTVIDQPGAVMRVVKVVSPRNWRKKRRHGEPEGVPA